MDMDTAIKFGRLHPMVLHFPIVCLLLALCFEWVGVIRRGAAFAPAVRGLLAIGVLTGIVTILTGLQFSEETTFEDERAPLFDRHRLMGFVAIGAAALALIVGEIYRRRPSGGKRVVYLLLVHVAAISVAVGGHAGALLHWGTDFLENK